MRLRTLAAASVALVAIGATRAQAQCPVNSVCFFGQDVNGTALTRATNVNAQTAHDAFMATLVGVGTEDFEARSGTAPLTLNFVGAGTATLSGGDGSVQAAALGSTNGAGRYGSSGTKYWEATSAAGGGSTFNIAFSNPVAAFGFFGMDIGDFGSQLSLVFTLAGGGTTIWALPYIAANGGLGRDGSILFAGFESTTDLFTSVSFVGTSADDVFAFDDMSIGSKEQVVNATPEPGSMVLMLTGIVGIGAVVRRRRRPVATIEAALA